MPTNVPQILLPWNRREAISVSEAAYITRKSERTVRAWALEHNIGRKVAGGTWMISHPALLMLLDGDQQALRAYLAGDRTSPAVVAYFARAEIGKTG